MAERDGQDLDDRCGAGATTAEPGAATAAPRLIAYRINSDQPLGLVPAPRARAWMERTTHHFANRCLPLLMANQAGWFLLNSHAVRATWNGGDATESLRLDFLSGSAPYPVSSHFGYGILTWQIPYLFRTPPGYNLLVRGPANWPKVGAFALEGLVETDWAVATFTMNWQMTSIDCPVLFEVNEPICMLVPQRRDELESFRPQVLDISTNREARDAYQQWSASRDQFLVDRQVAGSEASKQAWQKDYLRGTAPDGTAAPSHQTRLQLQEFDLTAV